MMTGWNDAGMIDEPEANEPVAMAGAAAALGSDPGLVEPLLSSGGFAQELIQRQIRRLGKLKPEVLADRDPEPLHQLRVSLRRLRTVLVQFGAALELPDRVSEQRIAALARRTSRCRDLDVLRLRLQHQLLPRLPEQEQRRLARAMQRLDCDRAKAFASLVEALKSARFLNLLERLNKWQKRPRLTPLGQLPLLPWLVDWQAPFTAGLFLHPGWMVEDPASETLHGLRKRIKAARYSLETLERWCEPPLQAWIEDLRQGQDHLGDLHDLQILQSNLVGKVKRSQREGLPVLQAEMGAQQLLHWRRWRDLAQRLHSDSHRSMLRLQLLALGSRSSPS